MTGMTDFQKALNEKGFEQIANEYKLKYVRHAKYPNLILFNYDQIHSPKMSPIVQSARGHILDESTNWSYVARPFDRFFNLGEANTPRDLDGLDKADSINVFTKEDGTLISMWFYDDKWHISTRNTPGAEGNIGQNTFNKLFWSTWQDLNYKLPDTAYNGYTFMFELCTPENEIKCVQIRPRIVLLGVRHNQTGREDVALETFESYEICTRHSTFRNTDDLRNSFRNYSGTELEGYVIAAQRLEDAIVLRYKVKNPAYLVLLRCSTKTVQDVDLLNLVRQGEADEFMATMPHLRERLLRVQLIYGRFMQAIETEWKRVAAIQDQKEFAREVSKLPNQQIIAIMFIKRKSADKSFEELLEKRKIDWILSVFDQEIN